MAQFAVEHEADQDQGAIGCRGSIARVFHAVMQRDDVRPADPTEPMLCPGRTAKGPGAFDLDGGASALVA